MKTFSGRPASQWPDELAEFIALLKREGARSYLEVGARDGDTFHAVMSALPGDALGVAVDLPGGKWGRDSRANLTAAVADLSEGGRDARVLWGDSQSDAVVEAVTPLAPFDAILIDGDHTYEAVAADWKVYGPLGRIVAFHDVDGVDGKTAKRGGYPMEVPKLWREVSAGRRSREIIGEDRGMGIGILWNA